MSSLPHINLRVNTVDAVADQLRHELARGSIEPGMRILPKEVAKRFSVSHIPVREALRRLEAEGLVAATPHGATYASEVRLEDLDGIYELRSVVEAEFGWRSARIRSDGDIRTLRQLWSDLSQMEPYSEPFFATHREFHWALLAPASSDVIRRVLDRLWRSTDRYLAVAVSRQTGFSIRVHSDATAGEHQTLVTAFEAGDAEALRDLLVTHLANTKARLRQAYLSTYEQ